MERLKLETRDLHQAVEARVDVMRPDLTLPDYQRLLAQFLGIYRPLEARLQQVEPLRQLLPDLDARWKTHLIELDLDALGCSTTTPEAEVSPIPGLPQAGGALYVMEGATLGGAIIARHVAQHLHLYPHNGCAFFNNYGDRRGTMWKTLADRLNTLPEPDAAVAGARQTFTLFEHWLGR
ncbi:MAG: biliverdin-producing heme oxygenase [Bryobacterales bacterium]|nr:biliverdin-producing heme oxygenase [Bryobacterales bacterium]